MRIERNVPMTDDAGNYWKAAALSTPKVQHYVDERLVALAGVGGDDLADFMVEDLLELQRDVQRAQFRWRPGKPGEPSSGAHPRFFDADAPRHRRVDMPG